MEAQQPVTVSVIEPIGPAIEWTKTILFCPFDLGKWFTIGFCAWLAYLGGGGGGGGGGGRANRGGNSSVPEQLCQAKEYILANLAWIVPLFIVGVVVGIVVWFFLAWLSSRGQFMLLHCVAHNKAEVTVPWRKFRQHANSLFLFRIVLGLTGFIVVVLPLFLAVGFIIMMVINKEVIGISILMGTAACLIILAGAIIFGLIRKFTMDFVVPIMFLRTTSCIAGWREFQTILSVNKARFALYILFQIVIGIAIGTITWMGFCIGCCLCCISFLLLIPYIGTVILLPLFIFKRAYSLLYLRQYGPQFDVFRQETENFDPV
ncbi:MAG: hypothetical protein JW837_10560 [Sedimentisphaerales bacterium]|nr:hypothetical protein [Sedimentisphaerales bacterium]